MYLTRISPNFLGLHIFYTFKLIYTGPPRSKSADDAAAALLAHNAWDAISDQMLRKMASTASGAPPNCVEHGGGGEGGRDVLTCLMRRPQEHQFAKYSAGRLKRNWRRRRGSVG